jgi:hypothetical protein
MGCKFSFITGLQLQTLLMHNNIFLFYDDLFINPLQFSTPKNERDAGMEKSAF